MKPVPSSPHDPIPPAVAEQAATWLARRDRGLTPAEQDDYLRWLHADPRHTEAVTQHAAALERMMQLYEWQPSHDTEPNPDLFLPRPSLGTRESVPARRPALWLWSAGLAAAAALAVAFYSFEFQAAAVPAASAPKDYLQVNERVALPDGSRAKLKDGSRVLVQSSETERRVKLVGGEAQFSVWKDKARPFIVDVGGIEVRAVGTVFNVRLSPDRVEVLVTEGTVKVDAPALPGLVLPSVTAGERAVMELPAQGAPVPTLTQVTVDDINRELDWQAPRLQFRETPLADAVAEFNRLNRRQIVIGDPALNERLIGGTFRPDNPEGFVRLLTETLGIRAETLPDGRTVLRP